jgi:hypothetical protein
MSAQKAARRGFAAEGFAGGTLMGECDVVIGNRRQ